MAFVPNSTMAYVALNGYDTLGVLNTSTHTLVKQIPVGNAPRQVILSGGARAANIYWQVGSSATLGPSSVFKGNLLAFTSITLQNGATVEGRLLARTAKVTLDSNTITPPAP